MAWRLSEAGKPAIHSERFGGAAWVQGERSSQGSRRIRSVTRLWTSHVQGKAILRLERGVIPGQRLAENHPVQGEGESRDHDCGGSTQLRHHHQGLNKAALVR